MSRWSIVLLWSAVFVGYLALGATIQALPPYVTGHFGGDAATAGWTVGVAFAATALCRPFAGRLADAGHSRIVVCGGGLLTAVGGLGHLIAASVGGVVVARIVMGAGEAALFSAAIPWVLASVASADKAKIAGWFGLSMWVGLACGPILASLLGAGGNVRAVWVAVTALGAASFLLAVCVRARGAATHPRAPLTLRGLLPRGSMTPGVVFGLSAYGYGALNAVLVLALLARESSAASYALTVFASAFLLTRLLGSPLVSRWGGRATWFVVLTIEVVGIALIAASSRDSAALAGAALTGVGVSLMFPATVAVTLQRAGPTAPGASVAVMTSFWDVGLLAAGPVSGAVADRFGYPAAFAVAAVVALGALGLAAFTSTESASAV